MSAAAQRNCRSKKVGAQRNDRAHLQQCPRTRRVRTIATLPAPLTHAAAAALGRRVYVIGGRGSALTGQTRAILAVDPGSGRVKNAGRLPVALSDAAAAAVRGRIVVAGGRDSHGGVLSDVLVLGPK